MSPVESILDLELHYRSGRVNSNVSRAGNDYQEDSPEVQVAQVSATKGDLQQPLDEFS